MKVNGPSASVPTCDGYRVMFCTWTVKPVVLQAGTGFTYTHASVGVYVFTFTTAYSAAPTITAVANDDNYRVTVPTVSTTGFTVHVQNMTLYPSQVGTLADGPFTFIAMATV